MSASPHLEAVASDMARCTSCASCRTGCPTFDATVDEGRSGRGRLQLAQALLDGRLAADDRVEELLASCARCGFCESACPVGIPVVSVIDAARAHIAEARGNLSWRNRLLCALLPHPSLLGFAMRFVTLWQRFRGAPAAGETRRLAGIGTDRTVPRLPWRTARERIAPLPTNTALDAPLVQLFTGCRTNWLMPDAALDVTFLLERAGAHVEVAREERCSGTVPLAVGAPRVAAALARANAATFAAPSHERVATMCASCLTTLRHAPGRAAAADQGAVAAFARRTADWSSVLQQLGWHGPFDARQLSGVVLVHEPCNARNQPGQAGAVLALLVAAGVDARPLTGVACCGGAAPFAVDQPGSSAQLERVAASAVRAAAEQAGHVTLVSSDPGCLLQLRSGLAGHAVTVLHAATALRRVVSV